MEEKLIIVDENGNEKKYNVVAKFPLEMTGKDYVLFEDIDQEGNSRIGAGTYIERAGMLYFDEPISTTEERKAVEQAHKIIIEKLILKKIENDLYDLKKNNNIKVMTDMRDFLYQFLYELDSEDNMTKALGLLKELGKNGIEIMSHKKLRLKAIEKGNYDIYHYLSSH